MMKVDVAFANLREDEPQMKRGEGEIAREWAIDGVAKG